MSDLQIGEGEARFADIIWNNEPIASGILAKQSEEQLGWKKTTSYTVLKRLCNKGLFKNEKGTVTSLISKQEFDSMKSEKFVEDTFNGSLPAFISAFTSRKKLSHDEIEQLRRMVAEFEEE